MVAWVDTIQEGIEAMRYSIIMEKNIGADGRDYPMRLVKRPDNQLIVGTNDMPIPRDWRYVALAYKDRATGEIVTDLR